MRENEARERSKKIMKQENEAREQSKKMKQEYKAREWSKRQNKASVEREHQDVLVEGREKEQVVWAKN
jgi:hypothetical protein